jgi:Mn-dependent DtxR family transcriptional regulator
MEKSLTGSARPGIGRAQRIIRMLEKYDRRVPAGFIAHMLGWRKRDVSEELEAMEELGLVELEGEYVELR